mgnify:CR=1 FL=1
MQLCVSEIEKKFTKQVNPVFKVTSNERLFWKTKKINRVMAKKGSSETVIYNTKEELTIQKQEKMQLNVSQIEKISLSMFIRVQSYFKLNDYIEWL